LGLRLPSRSKTAQTAVEKNSTSRKALQISDAPVSKAGTWFPRKMAKVLGAAFAPLFDQPAFALWAVPAPP
jgi:hypothetical protein